ncbi:hypothetical protein WS73_28240 [Burkholderia savannae]|nr:hypothetical protein WS73_28240 [Burkholderia savannae]
MAIRAAAHVSRRIRSASSESHASSQRRRTRNRQTKRTKRRNAETPKRRSAVRLERRTQKPQPACIALNRRAPRLSNALIVSRAVHPRGASVI